MFWVYQKYLTLQNSYISLLVGKWELKSLCKRKFLKLISFVDDTIMYYSSQPTFMYPRPCACLYPLTWHTLSLPVTNITDTSDGWAFTAENLNCDHPTLVRILPTTSTSQWLAHFLLSLRSQVWFSVRTFSLWQIPHCHSNPVVGFLPDTHVSSDTPDR